MGFPVLLVTVGFLLLVTWFVLYFVLHEERKLSPRELLKALWELLKELL